MINSRIIGTMIEFKLEVTDKVISKLPDSIQPVIRNFQTGFLSCLNDKISTCMEKKAQAGKGQTLKKVELE